MAKLISGSTLPKGEHQISLAIKEKPEFGLPYFCRIRECTQYGDSLEDYKRIMMRDNAGDYACGWLFGDTKSGEIMLLELGLNQVGCERTKNGVFYGSNGAHDERLRDAETKDGGYTISRQVLGAECAYGTFIERRVLRTNRPAHSPFGTIDGKVTDTALAKKMRFLGIWWSSCGKRVFRPKAFTRRFPRYKRIERWLPEFRSGPLVKL